MPLLCSPPYVHIFYYPLSLLSMCLDVHIQIFEQMPGCISRKSGVLRDGPAQPSVFSIDSFQVSTSQGRVTGSIHICARTNYRQYPHVTREESNRAADVINRGSIHLTDRYSRRRTDNRSREKTPRLRPYT
jgi:hypothetical protein